MRLFKFFSKVNSITPGEFKNIIKNEENFLLLDVRQPNEYEEVSLKESTLIPLFEISRKLTEKNKNKKIYVYCRSGKRSNLAARILKVKGYDNVYNISGGLNSILQNNDFAALKKVGDSEAKS